MGPISILYLEDDPLDVELSLSQLARAGISHQTKRVQGELEFVSALSNDRDDLILADFALPNFDGGSALDLAQAHRPDTPFIFVSGEIGEDEAIDLLHRGAKDYVLKRRLDRLVPAVKRALTEAEERKARREAEIQRDSLLERERLARAEAEARAKELAAANAELEQFTYFASHDLKEPLRQVKGYTQLLRRHDQSPADENALKYMALIEDGADRMEKLIFDLMAFSRVAHDHRLSLQPTNLDALLTKTLQSLSLLIGESGALVNADKLPIVLANEERMAHVFQNLLSNSVKYRSDQPLRIDISAERHGPEWTVTFRDNGIGFDQSQSEKIFGLFKRLHGNEYPGTGVGLAIVSKIVEQHGGKIRAQSVPNQGTAFFLTLQAA